MAKKGFEKLANLLSVKTFGAASALTCVCQVIGDANAQYFDSDVKEWSPRRTLGQGMYGIFSGPVI